MGKIISTVKYPITVQYDGESMVVSPGAKLKIKNIKLLGVLPSGIVLIKD